MVLHLEGQEKASLAVEPTELGKTITILASEQALPREQTWCFAQRAYRLPEIEGEDREICK